jgi:sec-independent protein translocase protein TatB
MFGFSGAELIVVLLVIILVMNPKDIPGTFRTIRDALSKLKNTASEFSQTILNDESTNDLKKEALKLNQDIRQIVDLNGNIQETFSLDDLHDVLPKKNPKKTNKKS